MTAAATDKPRRFYKAVSIAPLEGGFVVRLDERRLKTPAGAAFAAPTEALARAMAAEWDAQQTHIDTSAMPLTRLAFTAVDRGSQVREELAEEFARYAGSDVLCYRAEAPAALVRREAEAWDPWLDWARGEGIVLHTASGVVHKAQPEASLARAKALALELDDLRLTGLAAATALFGSAVLALAVSRGLLAGEAAFELAALDERFQAEQWGVDAEAAARTAAHGAEARSLDAWFKLMA
jgi:chaperone required for assembly of F1-ATPase